MRRAVKRLLVIILLVAGGDPVAPAQAAGCKVSGIGLQRGDGSTRARLHWRLPRGVPAGARFRVLRDGRVLGQRVRPLMRVRVSLRRKHRFRVLVVTGTRSRVRCSGARTIRIGYRSPGTPQHLSAGDAAGASVRLSWQPAARGDNPVIGYRVFRDGAVNRQTRDSSVTIPLASNRSHRVEVAAVDRQGVLGPRSRPVTVVTGHAAPPAPADLAATTVDEQTISLAWAASIPPRGRIAGYRILRDGVPVRQVAGTTARLENLFAGRDYTFTVAAVDTLGYVSEQSAPARASTAPPQPTRGQAHAFLLASTDQSFRDLQANYARVGTVYPTFYDCDLATAALHGRHDELITSWAQARRVRVLPRFNCQRGHLLHRILTEPELRSSWIDTIVSLVEEHGYDGAALDFEAGFPADRPLYTAFVADLAARLHARGRALTLAVSAKVRDVANHPRSTFFDYVGLSEHADTLFVMAWGIRWATSAPGAQDDIVWVRSVADYVATMTRRERFVMGTQLYAMDWAVTPRAGEQAEVYEHDEAVARAARLGAPIRLDAAADSLTFSYTGADGRAREVWFPDAGTLSNRMRIARERGLGVGFWRLGREDQRLWADPLLG